MTVRSVFGPIALHRFDTPHASDGMRGWPWRFAERFVDNLDRRRAGVPLLNRITP